jgi:hypothetical protein
MFPTVAVLSLVLSCARAATTNLTIGAVDVAFRNNNIFPAVIPSWSANSILDVSFPSVPIALTAGQNLTIARASEIIVLVSASNIPQEVAQTPSFYLSSNITSYARQRFVLTVIDPDAPTPEDPSLAQFRHYLASDLTVNTTNATIDFAPLQLGTENSDWYPPAPPYGSPHR